MNDDIKHHAKGLATALKKAAHQFMENVNSNDFSFEAESTISLKKGTKTYEKKIRYSSDVSFEDIKEEE